MKIFLANFRSAPMNITANHEKAMQALDSCIENGCDTIVYPTGCLLGAPLGVLQNAEWVTSVYNTKMTEIYRKADCHGIAVVADSIDKYCTPEINGECRKATLCGFKTAIAKSSEQFFGNVNELCSGTDIVFLNWMEPGVAGQKHLWLKTLEAISEKYGTAFVLNTAGNGYTTHPDFYMPLMGVVAGGKAEVYHNFYGIKNCPQVFCIEKTQLKEICTDDTNWADMAKFSVCYNQNPLVPADMPEKEYCLDLFDMQCEALANRLGNINCKNIVLNLSGGLDSTMALLVCANTFEMMGLDKSGMHIITQPGFGTSHTTKGLAYELCEALGLELKLVDITETCRAALLSVGHDGVTPDVTLENVQARTRTMNALNLANHINAIMVGTGDLSEIALGFSTFGGDQLASYNVNSCISKTVMRTMLKYVVELDIFKDVKAAVNKVLDIPVSPELVPHGGEILQKTEDILAPYKLIDFYIYCTVTTKIAPSEIVCRAYDVFDGEFTTEYITEKLKMFYRKFGVGQFKRSCAPECANLTHVSLIGKERSFASDGSYNIFVQNLD